MIEHVATGHSMLPSILPGSVLETVRIDGEEISVGDIICYVGGDREVVAHRVTGIDQGSDSVTYRVRGDAQYVEELVEPSAVALMVKRVRIVGIAYSTDGALGRFFKTLALGRGAGWNLWRHGTVEGISGLIRASKIVGRAARWAMSRRRV